MNWQRSAAITNSFLWLTTFLLFLLPIVYGWSSNADSVQWTPYRSIKSDSTSSFSSSTLKETAPKATTTTSTTTARQLNAVSPYIDMVLCPLRAEPWTCARQQSGRILDVWDDELYVQWQKLKVEADRQLNATLQKRGYSTSEVPIKEKPSTILSKIEIGTNYMKDYLAETMDGFLGREYEYMKTEAKTKENVAAQRDEAADADDEDEDDDDDDEETNADNDGDVEEAETDEQDEDEENDVEEDDEAATDADEDADEDTEHENDEETAPNGVHDLKDAEDGVEFIELEEAHEANVAAAQSVSGQLKKPSKGGAGKRKQKKKKNKSKKKKKGQSDTQPATLVVVQAAAAEQSGHGHGGHGTHEVEHDISEHVVSSSSGGGHGHSKPYKRKQKRGKRKKKGQHGAAHGETETIIVEHEPSNHLGLGLLDELADADDFEYSGGKRKHKNPSKYGRSNGVTRGKKKKKKKMLAKLVFLGSFLKAKIELLLKILGAHLQIKFFAIALIGLLINIARFWIDVKRGGSPQKVVYVEHAHHQHHYEDHGSEDWSEPGSYWKRSLHTDSTLDDADSSTDSYQPRPPQTAHDAHYLAYKNQWQ